MSVNILTGDCTAVLRTLPEQSVHCCVTSPPYWGLRDYGVGGQLGLEKTPEEYVEKLVEVFAEVRRVLWDDGTLWVNIGDSYNANGRAGHGARIDCKQGTNRASAAGMDSNRPHAKQLKQKDLVGIPWRLAFALQADGWYLRQDIIWHKPNPMPESVQDRCTKAHEYVFMLSKKARYYYDAEAVREPGVEPDRVRADRIGGANGHTVRHSPGGMMEGSATRNRRDVWTIPTQAFPESHFATFPPALVEPCIKAGCPPGGTVLDPFAGAGTTGLVADRLGRNAVLIELNPEYAEMARERITQDAGMFANVD
uniref:site-specific DNA-methyltransferase (cytosine-N(4)-specific) n=2 Tax=viral metagenome TaxID=1070528 RepID=A0A6M3KI27_9ZZZZ